MHQATDLLIHLHAHAYLHTYILTCMTTNIDICIYLPYYFIYSWVEKRCIHVFPMKAPQLA